MTGYSNSTEPQRIALNNSNRAEWVERDCDGCGERFKSLAFIHDNSDRHLCHDCQPDGPLDVSGSIIGGKRHLYLAVNRPLMEYGPLSHGQ